MRVPLPLVSVVGCKELKLSLYESRRQAARLKSAVLAFHIRGFFSYLQRAMRTLSRTEVLRLVEDWRARMIARDSEVRRLVETGLTSYSLMQWGDACEATGDQLADLADSILPLTPGDDQRQPLRGQRLQRAYEEAAELATAPVEPANDTCDWLPVIDRCELPQLDEISKRDLLQSWLPSAARLYYAKASVCANVGGWLEALSATSTLSEPLVNPEPEQSPAPPKRPAQPQAMQEVGPSLMGAWERYVRHQSEREAAWRSSVPDSARLAWQDFSSLLGGDTPLTAVDRQACKRYETFANNRPRRALPAFKDLTAQQIEELDVPREQRLSRSGITEELNRIGSFFKWCVREHLIDRNPAEGLQALLVDGKEGETAVQAWSTEELQTLLSPTNLKAFMESHRNARGAVSEQRWTYFPWLLVLAAYTGARLEELGGLEVSDVVERHPESEGRTPVIIIQPNTHRTLKTDQAKRTIPIHPDLERLGLWELVSHRRDDIQADRLLWTPHRGDRVAGKATDDFKEYTETLGLYKPRIKVFHSFRHTFKTRARGVMENGALNSIVGHQANDSTGGVYEHALQTPRQEHLAQMSRLSYGLNIGELTDLLTECRSVAPITKAFSRRPKAPR